jgi:hypothetical protein
MKLRKITKRIANSDKLVSLKLLLKRMEIPMKINFEILKIKSLLA